MSRFEDLKDQLKQQGQSVWEKIQESSLYNQLQDRYQSLSPSGQKSVLILSGLIAVGAVISYPALQLSQSQVFIEEFENRRDLIRGLFKAYRDSGAHLQMQAAPPAAILMSSIQSSLTQARLIPEQIISVTEGHAEGKLIPSQLLRDVIEVKLARLNLRQIVDIGTQLTNLSSALKVKDLLIQANDEYQGYFDVTYSLYTLKVPEVPIEAPPEPELPKKKKKSDSGNDESSLKGED